jgi:CRISPR-associated protein Cas1
VKDRTLHVGAIGAVVRKVAERLEVWHCEARVGHARLFDLEAVHLYGRAHVTAAALQACMASGVRVCWYSRTRLVARCEPESASHVLTRIAQVDRLRDTAWRLGFARDLVHAKLAAQHCVIQRWRHGRSEATVAAALDHCAAELARLQQHLGDATTDDGLRGLEGMGAALHFRGLAELLRSGPARDLGFAGRLAHPPGDAVNAALSFGYVLLANELAGLLAGLGLDPAIGLLHGLRSGRDSLALDAVEPYRAPVVDALVAQLLARKMLTAEDFIPQGRHAVYLTPDGRAKLLQTWEAWMRAPERGASVFGGTAARGQAADSWRHALRAQAVALRSAIVHKQPVTWYWDQDGGPDGGIEVQGRPKAAPQAKPSRPARGKEQ